jgi:hypothetical protein
MMIDSKYKLRSHVCLNIARYQSKYLFRQCLSDMSVLNDLFDWLQLITKNTFSSKELELFPDIMQQRLVNIALRLPITCHNPSLHILYHLPSQIKHFGPLCELWAFGFERWLGFLKKGINNRKMPSASMLNYYLRSIHLLSEYAVYSGNEELNQQNLDLAKQASASYPLSSVESIIAKQIKLANSIYMSPSERRETVVMKQEAMIHINDSLFYSNELWRDAWHDFRTKNPLTNRKHFEQWALDPNTVLDPDLKRLAAGFLPRCGYLYLL